MTRDDFDHRVTPERSRAGGSASNAPRSIRVATQDDAADILAIYAPNVLEPAISMETAAPDVATMRQRIEKTLATYPFLVEEHDGRIAGYVYAGPHRERQAWHWCCETTVYAHRDFRRLGVAERLYRALFALLRLQKFRHAFAFIMLPNPSSVRLHERCGFVQRAYYPQAGHKQGAWYDVGAWQLALGPLPDAPEEPIAFPQLDAAALAVALR